MNKIILICFSLLLILSFVLSEEGTSHCLRQDISRWKNLSPTVTFSPADQIISRADGSYTVPLNSTLTIEGFGAFNYYCDDGWSPLVSNYFDIYDNINKKIIVTNGINGSGGPESAGSTICAKIVDGSNKICYIDGCGPDHLPCGDGPSVSQNTNYMVGDYAQCFASSFTIGTGKNVSMIISLSQYLGDQDWSLRLGAISPGGVDPNSQYIMPIEVRRIKFSTASSSMLVFSPKPLERVNSFENSGIFEKEVYFTLLNKSKIENKIIDYNIVCPADVNCTLEQYNGNKMYKDFIIGANNALAIELKVSFNKNNIPKKFSLYMNVSYSPQGVNTCDLNPNGVCHTSSSPVNFESGLLDQQTFQINIAKQDEQKYCIDAQGNIGSTGAAYNPRINLYFGGNNSPQVNSETELISMDECSPQKYSDLSNNPDWVYCSQKEFITQLGARLGKYGQNMININSLESLGRFAESKLLREENGRLLGFNAYLRQENISKADMVAAVTGLNNFQVPFTKLGFSGEVDNLAKLNTLVNGIDFVQTVNGLKVNDNLLVPGEYRVTVDINATAPISINGSYLFTLPAETLTNGLNIKVNFEKINSTKFNWFFYYSQSDSFAEDFATPTPALNYITNVIDRGTILNFEKNNSTIITKNFYSTYAVPLIIKIKDKNVEGVFDSKFEVSGYNQDIFTYWTAFASSLGDGCETTSITPPNAKKVLPYRVNDSNLGNAMYEIRELRDVLPNSIIYLGTVLYLPVNDSISSLKIPFKVFTKKETIDGDIEQNPNLLLTSNDSIYSQYKFISLKEVLGGINSESVCVIYDKSTGTENWKLFWNQDKMLDSLKVQVKPSITDAKICQSRELMSS